jgi:acetyltransferase-like isoleucine patch superfamily enzyme
MDHKNTRKTIIGKSPFSVGRFTYGHENIVVKQWNEGAPLEIGAFCSIASNVQIFLGGNHRADWITTFPFGHIFQSDLGGKNIQGHPATKGGVSIGNDVWIGQGVTVMSGISIGDGAIIAANSTVVKMVPPYSIVGGNPARHLKFRFSDEIISLLLEFKWWELSIEEIKKLAIDLSEPPDTSKLRELIRIYR